MTTCFVAQFGPFCLAAADTRFSAEESTDLFPAVWDAADLPLTTASGTNHVLPYRFRKIRQLAQGWAVMAGCFVTGQRMLDLLQRERSSSAADSLEILQRGWAAELATLGAMPDVSRAGLYVSRLLGVPANADRTEVWIGQLDETAGYTIAIEPQFAMNWPTAISPAQQTEAQAAFFSSLTSFNHVADILRTSAVLIGTARTAPDSSPFAQIGITWQSGEMEFASRYLHGHVDEIAAMANDEIIGRWEVLAP